MSLSAIPLRVREYHNRSLLVQGKDIDRNPDKLIFYRHILEGEKR